MATGRTTQRIIFLCKYSSFAEIKT